MGEYQLGERIVVIGRGGSDARSAAEHLADATGRILIRIDKHFWPLDHRPNPAAHWAQVQAQIADNPAWVMDADLGPFDIDEPMLGSPDEIWVLDLNPLTCLGRALRYRNERRDLRVWLFRWRGEYLRAALPKFVARQPETRLRRFAKASDLRRALAAVDHRSGSDSEPTSTPRP